MDNRITKQRLKQLLSYDLWKIIALILAGILVWSLLFTMFGDSLSEGQSLNIYAYNVTVNTGEMNGLLEDKGDKDFKSYEVRETQFYNFGPYSASNTTINQQFAAWTSVGQLDVFFVSNGEDMEVTETNSAGEQEKVKISLAANYASYFYDLEALAADAINYCMRFGGGTESGEIDTAAVEKYFIARKKRDNFYRHGLIDAAMEVDRFEKIWYAANKLKGYLADETLDIWYKLERGESKGEQILGIDFGKLDKCGGNAETGKRAVNLCSIGKTEESGSSTADGVVMAIFNNKSFQPDLVYESLAFAVRVIEDYSAL